MILGVDPGLTGALAVYDDSTNQIIFAYNTPTLEIKRNGKMKRALDFHALMGVINRESKDRPAIKAVLEHVNGMKGQGVSSVFSFGKTAGATEMALVAANVPYTLVTPQKWKKALGCTADKDGTLLRASQLMPRAINEWTPVRGVRNKEECIGIAEAALLAYYGAKILC